MVNGRLLGHRATNVIEHAGQDNDLQHADNESDPLDDLRLGKMIRVMCIVSEAVEHSDAHQDEAFRRSRIAVVTADPFAEVHQCAVYQHVEGRDDRATRLPLNLQVGNGIVPHAG